MVKKPKKAKLRYIQSYVSKGKVYYYFRRGEVREPIPHDPDTPEFSKAYWELRSGKVKRKVNTTFDALIDSYYQTPKFKNLAPGTQKEYRRGMELLRKNNGPRDFTKLRRKDVIAARDKYADTWRKANGMVENISILARHAIDLEWIAANPAQGVEKLKGGNYEPWPDALLVKFEEHCTEQELHLERVIYELCIGTGQRIGDVCEMKWEQFTEDGYMQVLQEKTGTFIELYCPQRLQDTLASWPREGRYVLRGERTEHLSKRRAQSLIQNVRKQIGAEKYVIHGWRYNAAKELAETGATDAEIQSVTGHLTVEMVKKYRGQAQRKKLSKAAQQRREK